MSDQNDDNQNYALMVLAGVVGLVIAGVIALAASRTMGHGMKPAAATSPAAAPAATAPAAAASDTAVALEPLGRIYFDLASDALPPDAAAVIARAAEAARGSATRVIQVSGYHDASGDAAKNAELAKQRALAVRDALVAAGLPADRIQLDKPVEATGGADAREARRVELRVH